MSEEERNGLIKQRRLLREKCKQKDKEIERLNNIINELEKYINERFNVCRECQIASFKEHNNYSAYNGELLAYESILDKLKALKENNK